jgi:23S rRNA (guanosine2251-2'-O)-methyltransferase
MKPMRRNTPPPPGRHRSRQRSDAARSTGENWLWGTHAVLAALANPRREPGRLLATPNAAARLPAGSPAPELLSAEAIGAQLPPGAVHQGLALHCAPLEPLALEDAIAAGPQALAVLDQVSDPQNLGAIFRSAAAFGIGAIILQTRHTPPITGVVAKSATGAIETVAEVRTVNISRALGTLADAGYHTIGLDGSGPRLLEDAIRGSHRTVIVLGAEGAGLRPGVAQACAELARIPIAAEMESLNVSNAAAIAFYELARSGFRPD